MSFKTRYSKPSNRVTQYRNLKIIGSRDTEGFQEEGESLWKAIYIYVVSFLLPGKKVKRIAGTPSETDSWLENWKVLMVPKCACSQEKNIYFRSNQNKEV